MPRYQHRDLENYSKNFLNLSLSKSKFIFSLFLSRVVKKPLIDLIMLITDSVIVGSRDVFNLNTENV